MPRLNVSLEYTILTMDKQDFRDKELSMYISQDWRVHTFIVRNDAYVFLLERKVTTEGGVSSR